MSAQTNRLKKRLTAIPRAVKQAVVPALLTSGNELADQLAKKALEQAVNGF